jgi:hypothetical protein
MKGFDKINFREELKKQYAKADFNLYQLIKKYV